MERGRRFFAPVLTALVIAALAVAFAGQHRIAAQSTGLTPLHEAWAKTERAGRYRFETRLIQTTLPPARITAVGRSAREQSLVAKGMSDRAAGVLELSLWDDRALGAQPDRATEVRIEGAKAFGRTSASAEWQPIGDVSSAFAPAGDAAAFLSAAANVTFLGRDRRDVPAAAGGTTSLDFDRYRFTLNAEQFAETQRKQLQAELDRSGDLPAGVKLSSSDRFRRMVAVGEAWIGADGLPLRLTIDMEFPLQPDGERERVSITTRFLGFDSPGAASAAGGLADMGNRLAAGLASFEVRQTALHVSLLLMALCAAVGVAALRTLRARRPVLAFLSLQLAFAPLSSTFDLAQWQRFMQRFPSLAQAAPPSAGVAQTEAPPFDTERSPLGDESQPAKPTPSPAKSAILAPHVDGPDTDEDGLEDSLEGPWYTSASNPDSDGDGMSDGSEAGMCPNREGWYVGTNEGDPACPDPYFADSDLDGLTDTEEVLYLGTLPQVKDSDGDGITDAAEVSGFLMPVGSTRRWSNPLNPDTDGDGRLDGVECPALRRTDITSDYRGSSSGNSPWTSGTRCEDTDADGVPDIFDFDSDGDGVPDTIDQAPTRAFGLAAPFNRSQPLNLRIAGAAQNRPLMVDLQIRPVVSEHLSYALNVLDWPVDDAEGQVQRLLNNSFGDVSGGDDRAYNGDMRITPMLEITLPGDTLDLPRTTPSQTLPLAAGGRIMGVLDLLPNASAVTLTVNTLAGALPGAFTIGQGTCQASSLRWASGPALQGNIFTHAARLADFANGAHVATLVLDGDTFCTPVPKLTEGVKRVQVVLQEPLEPLGTLRMSQIGSPAFRFDLTAAGAYSAVVSSGDCTEAGATTFTLGSVTSGASINLPVANLTSVVDGGHVLRLARAGQTLLCTPLGNLVNGSLTSVIDAAKLAPYQISVSENADGTLAAFAPLTPVVDRVSGKTEALSARMFYQHNTATPISHTVNLVWLVTVLTDACPDANCNRPDAVVDQPRVVHQYRNESWVVTGLHVNEELGVDVAVVFEDPAAESDTDAEKAAHKVEWDDALWQLANGLQRIFVEGVDCDAGVGVTCAVTPDGQRDLRVADIKARWDTGGGASQTARWDIDADALNVVTSTFAHTGEMGSLSESLLPSLLQQHFGNGVFPFGSMLGTSTTQVFPTFLVAGEQRYRGVGAEATANVSLSGRSLSADFDPGPATSRAEPVTAATLSWKPFRYGAAGWEPMPAADYWDHLEKMLPLSASYTTSGDRENVFRSAADVRLTQVAYLNLYAGIGKIVEATNNSQAYLMSRIEGGSQTTDKELENTSSIIKASGETTGGFSKAFIEPMYEVLDFEHGIYKRAQQSGSRRMVTQLQYTIKGSIGRAVKNAMSSFTGYDRLFDASKNTTLTGKLRGIGGAVTSSAAQVMVGLAKSLAGVDSKGNATQLAVVNALQGIATAQGIGDNAKTVYSFLKLKAAVGGSNIKAFSALTESLKATKAAKVGAVIGLVIELGFAFALFAVQTAQSGVEAFSLQFNAAFSQVVAGAIVAVLLAALASTGVGSIVVAIIGLIDSVINLFCGIFPPADDNAAAQWTCKGLSGILAEGVAYFIYDATDIIDVSNPDRLRFTRFNPYLTDASAGFVTGASVKIDLGLDNTIETQPYDSPLSFLYGWQFNEENTRDATFTYAIVDAAETDESKQIHTRVQIGDNPAAWTALGGDRYRRTILLTESEDPLALPAPGVNAPIAAYLAEGYATPTQECIVIPNIIPPWFPPVIPICYVRSRDASNYLDLNLVFDVFPATLSEFYSLVPKSHGYALAWGQTGKVQLPFLYDADGDGLNFAIDPNDSMFDADGDGLTDLREVRIGTLPTQIDTDNDGLSDLDELRFGSDPQLADTDADGLTDALEKEGWSIGYNFVNGSAKLSWAYSDPRVADADDDDVFDARERSLGTGPFAAGDPSIVRYTADLRETDATLLLMRFDEGSNAETFKDRSGPASAVTGHCSEPACPISGVPGIAVNAAYFDGNDVVSLGYRPAINLLTNGFSIAAWVKADNLTGRHRIISIARTNAVAGFSFGVDNGNLLFTAYGRADFNGTALSAIPLGEWVHVGVVVEPNGGQTVARFYVNTELKESITRNIVGMAPSPNDAVLIGSGIAVQSTALEEPWVGYIDDLAMYSRPIDESGMWAAYFNLHNLDDATLTSEAPVVYETEIESVLLTRNIEGVLQTALPSFLSGASAPATVMLSPRQALPVVTRTLSFNTTPASGEYAITQTLGAIVDVPYKPETSQDAALVYRSNAPLAFAGSLSDRREVLTRTDFDLSSTDFTLSLWLSPDPFADLTATRGVFGFRSGEPNGYPSIQQIGSTLRFGYGTGSAWVSQDLANGVPIDGKWHHLVVSFQRNSGGNAIATVYVDNVNRGSLNFGSSRPGSPIQRFDIGRSSQTARFRFTQFNLVCEADGIGDGEYTINYFNSRTGTNALYWSGTGTDGANLAIGQGWREFEDAVMISVCENDTNGSDKTTCDGDDERMMQNDLLPFRFMSTSDKPYASDVTQQFSTTPTDPNCGFWVGYDDTANLSYRFDNNSIPFIGDLKDVRLYRRSLSASDVTNLYLGNTVLARFMMDERPGATRFADDIARTAGACAGASCPVTGVPGRNNVAARFDGVNDYVTADQVSALAHTASVSGSGFSFGAWIKPDLDFDVFDSEQYVLSFNGNNYDNRLLLGIVADGPGHFKVRLFDGVQQITTPGNYARGQWHHISALLNYNFIGEDKLIINGNNVTNVFSTTSKPAADGRFSIGQEWDTSGVPSDFFKGMVDQVSISEDPANPAYVEYFAVPLTLWHMDALSEISGNFGAKEVAGQVYGGFDLGGSSEFISLPPVERGVPQYSSFTIMGWVYPRKTTGNGTPTYRPILGSHLDNSPWMGLVDGKPALYNRLGDSVMAARALPPEQWSHVAFQREAGQLRLYVNGSLVGTHTQTTGSFALIFNFGRAANPGSTTLSFFDGVLDEFSFHYSTVSAETIRAAYNYQATWHDESRRTPFVVDVTPPTVRLVQDGLWLAKRAETLLVDAADAHSRVESAMWFYEDSRSLDSGLRFPPVCGDAAGGAAFCGLFDPQVEGRYRFETAAADAAGNLGVDPSNRYLYVDGTGPSLTLTPLPAAALAASRVPDQPAQWTVALGGTAVDPVLEDGYPSSGIASVRVRLFDANGRAVGIAPEQIATLNGGAWSIQYALLADNPTGRYTGAVLARDQVGNETVLPIASFTIDNTDPSSRVTTYNAPQTTSGANLASEEMLRADAGPLRAAALAAGTPVAQYLNASSSLAGTASEQPDSAGTQSAVAGIARVELAFEPMFGSEFLNRPLPAGVALYLPFDENNKAPGSPDTSFRDLVNSYTVTCSVGSCPAAAVATRNGQGVYFDAAGARLSRAATSGMTNLTNNFAVGAWVKLDGVTGIQHIVGTDRVASPNNGWAFGIEDDKLRFDMFGASSFATSQPALKAGVWHHVAAFVTVPGNVEFYVNGEYIETVVNGGPPGIANTDDALVVGGMTAASPQPLAGVIDELFVYNAAGQPMWDEALARQLMGDGPTLHLTFDKAPVSIADVLQDSGGMDVLAATVSNSGGDADRSTVGAVGAYGLEFSANKAFWIGASTGRGVLPDDNGPWTLALWLRDLGEGEIYVGQDVNAYPAGFVAGLSGPAGRITYTLGGNTYPVTVGPTNEWHHYAFAWDGAALRTYQDGAARQVITPAAPILSVPAGWLDMIHNDSPTPTAVDDVQFFKRMLSVEELSALARTNWQTTTLASSGTGVTTTTWTSGIPPKLEGFYAVRSRAVDTLGNANAEPVAAWSGMVDTLAPRLRLTATVGGVSVYQLDATDFSLDVASIGLPAACVGNTTTGSTNFGSPWYLAMQNQDALLAGPRLNRLQLTCTVGTPLGAGERFTVCDGLGNCAAVDASGNPARPTLRRFVPSTFRQFVRSY